MLIYTDEAGNVFEADLAGLETLTILDTVGQTITYQDEDGNTFVADITDLETLTALDTVGQTIRYTDEDGNTFIADITDLETTTNVTAIVTDHEIATYRNEDGDVESIYETITSFVDNADGTVTYTPEFGPAVTVPKADLTDNGDGMFTFTNNDGTCLLYTSPSPRDLSTSRMPSSA